MYITGGFKIFSLYGPLSINFYGFFIALGLLLCMKLITLNRKYKELRLQEKFVDIIIVGVIAGIIGGRIVDIYSAPHLYPHISDLFALWDGGFSALGSIISVIGVSAIYIHSIQLPVLPIFDLVALYAPLFQAIARLGCLFAGCCHGIPTQSHFSFIYTHPETIALRNIALFPTQLLSSFILLLIFFLLFFVVQHRVKQPGLMFCIYLSLACVERFVVDFWRADRIITNNAFFSLYQQIAIVLLCITLGVLFYIKKR